ncbi:MAG: YhdP family protein [Woeseiaceae bacterium]|nr:YhdP family protein [Woeseiaceae bacterium]
MKKLFQKVFKVLAYTIAGFVILLAIGVGLLRLFLPRLPEYQEQIKVWASDAIGVGVEFSAMDARWGLNGPELKFLDAELIRPDNLRRIVAAEEVSISVALIRLMTERTVAIDRVVVRDSQIEVRRLDTGEFWFQGSSLDELLPPREQGATMQSSAIELIGENIELLYLRSGDERPRRFAAPSIVVRGDETRIAIDAEIYPPSEIADELLVSATYLTDVPAEERVWDVFARIEDVELPALSTLVGNEAWRVTSGGGDADVSIKLADDGVQSASIDVDLIDLSRDGQDPVALKGLVEYRREDDGWLLAGTELELATPTGEWPQSSFRLDTGLDEQGSIAELDVRSDYVNLRDLRFVTPLLDPELGERLDTLSPRGEIRDLDLTLSGIGTERLTYAVSADLSEIGFEAIERVPGLRGFSARVRADMSGGRVEMRSENLTLLLFDYLSEPIELDSALGTIIWRRSGDRTTVLSDNISLNNGDLQSQTNVQITIDGDASPEIDLASEWTLSDLGSAKRYIPEKLVSPKLYRWFQDALLSGSVNNGRTRLYGPLDKFPFDGGEGRFLLEATITDLLFKYLPRWPAAEVRSMDIVLDNTRLYTERNLSFNEGREVRDARVEIADLREAVLTIDGRSDGAMQSLLDFSRNSPLDDLLGGALGRISVGGSATADIDLLVPLKQSREFEIEVSVVADDAELRIDGLNPPITGMNGRVVIRRDSIESESLTAQFLGEPIDIVLTDAQETGFRYAADIEGSLSIAGLSDGFGLPVDGLIDGSTSYTARILFPTRQEEDRQPLTLRIASDLAGVEVTMPPPFGKSADVERQVTGDIRFPGGGDIASAGRTDDFTWDLSFVNDDGMAFERGTLVVGEDVESELVQTRGLHIRGNVPQFYLDDWLAVGRGDGSRSVVIDEIRSADVVVDDLRLLGQRFRDHSVEMDRSARDWLIQVDGEQVSGSITLPYEFGPESTLVLEMQRLILPGDDLSPGGRNDIDPRNLPAMTIRADEFAIRERYFGRVEADVNSTGQGLVADRIIANDASFEVFGNGRWVVNEDDASGFRTYAVGGLRSNDIKATMDRLNYQPGLNGDDLSVIFDVNWSGGPSAEFVETLDGEVQVNFGPGQLDDVDPGAGRVFGLLSIVALPRRLSLDFSDVFQKGFGFDTIEGVFRIDDGDTYTCNLTLEGPAAAIGIVGRAGLTDRDYAQSAIVSASFGDTLPVVGGLVAGPQVAAALLIFSQIFKKPLQDLSQVYYDIGGTWDEPSIESSDAASFAETGRLSGCIEDAQ